MLATELFVDAAVLPDRVLVHARIRCGNGRIMAIEQGSPGPGVLRLHGTLLPGFVDLQVNGAGGRSVDEATPTALEAVADTVWQGGAVAFLPTLITAPWPRLLEQVHAVATWIRGWNGRGAEPLGLHLEGPFLASPGAHDPAHFVDPTLARLDQLLAAANGTLRLVTLANSRPGAADAVAHLRRAGVAVALGHVADTAGFAACVDAGATLVTHLFNVMGALHHREPGIAGLALDEPRLGCPLIVDGAHVHPAMVRNAFAILGPDRTMLVTDAVGAAGMPDGDYTLAGIAVQARAGVVRDAKGRLAGSALTMALAARNFLAMVPGAGDWTLGRIAAANPARCIGAAGLGAIEVGAAARFSLRSDDGTIVAVAG
ncbi:MAG: amidohydrolase family protein [Planctomycetes bacterium]|nr:amidohydrolase family protein [Planctomycetota bacterium]